MNRGQMTTA